MRWLSCDVEAAKYYASAIGPKYTINKVKDSGLSGTVRADQTYEFVRTDGKAQLAYGMKSAEMATQILDFEQHCHLSHRRMCGQC